MYMYGLSCEQVEYTIYDGLMAIDLVKTFKETKDCLAYFRKV